MKLMKGILFVMLMLPAMLQAALDIRITKGVEGAIPIAIAPFELQTASRPSQDIGKIVSADLKRSGRFSPISSERFAQPNPNPGNIELYRWRDQRIDYIMVGKITDNGAGSYNVTFQLFDSGAGTQIAGYSIPAAAGELRMAAHQVADLIYEAILGVRGAFNTRIAYITTKGHGANRKYVIEVSDSDGYNARTVLSAPNPLMSPDWSPDNSKLAYVSFENNHSNIFVQEVATGRRQKISSRKGINGAPAWSPDGSRLAVTLSEGGSPNIYIIDLATGSTRQLTHDRSINTEPAWMPDGQSIIFTSNRTGKPQLYRISVNGGEAKRLTFDGEYNSAASVSPDGTKVAMVNGDGGRFRIAVLDLQSGETSILTNGRLDESPSFAPNGSMIIYATESGGRGVLAAVSDDGRIRQILALQEGEVREPDWSGFLN